jgi:thioredoxin 2
MAHVTLACQFCSTSNNVDLAEAANAPKCSECQRPFRLDRPIKVLEEDFDTTVLGAEVPVLVDFYADWCGPCVMMAPILDEIASEMMGEVLVAKVNTDTAPTVSQRYGVQSIPFFARFEQGEVVNKAVGAVSREALRELAGAGA